MPVRSLNSAVLRWPRREEVLDAARRWAAQLRQRDPAVRYVFAVGSYARGDWGVGSDLDVIVILGETNLTPVERYARYYPDGVPVPADVWVYTQAEWAALHERSPLLAQRLEREAVSLL